MNVSSIRSVQRVVNFTLDDGDMLKAEHSATTISGVTMMCDLPLLFINKLPTCLENLTVRQLEQFVPYLIKHFGGSSQTKPRWWPHDVDFSATPAKTSDMSEGKWLSHLKRLVSSCYSYHGCDYALRLCANPSHGCRSTDWIHLGLNETMSENNRTTRLRPATRRRGERALANLPLKGEVNTTLAITTVDNVSVRQNKSKDQAYICDMSDTEFSSSKDMWSRKEVCVGKGSAFASSVYSQLAQPMGDHRARVPSRNCAPNNGPRVRRMTTSRIRRSLEDTQTLNAKPLPINRRRFGNQKTPSEISPSKDGYSHNRSEEMLNSFAKMKDDTLFLKNKSQRLPHLQHPSSNTDVCINNNNNEQVTKVLPHKSSGRPKKDSPIRKKKMSLMSSIHQAKKLNQHPGSDIFLCDYCDEEFTTVADVRRHKTQCSRKRIELTPSPVVCTEEKELTQEMFLNCFRLATASGLSSTAAAESNSSRRKSSWNLLRYSGIPVSSPFGNRIYSRSQLSSAAIFNKMDKAERFCSNTPTNAFHSAEYACNADQWKVSWKTHKGTKPGADHLYRFPIQRWWQIPSLRKTQKDIQARNGILLSMCRPLKIKLRKLTAQEIEVYTSSQTLRPKVKKLTTEEVRLYTNRYSVTPKLRRLSAQEIEAYTSPIAPKVQRLSLQEIEKHMKTHM